MGERIANLRYLIRYLRTTEPKYAFERLIFHLILAVVGLIFSILGDWWLWGITTGVLYLSLMIYGLRVRRVVRRRG